MQILEDTEVGRINWLAIKQEEKLLKKNKKTSKKMDSTLRTQKGRLKANNFINFVRYFKKKKSKFANNGLNTSLRSFHAGQSEDVQASNSDASCISTSISLEPL